MRQRQLIQQQINDLMRKATQRPGNQDDMGTVGFASALLAAQMQSLLLQEDLKEDLAAKPEEARE